MSEFQENLLDIALTLGMAFLVGLCLYRATREIPPLGDRREKIVFLYIAAIFTSGSVVVVSGLLGWEVVNLIFTLAVIGSIWGFSFFILRYWKLVASGAVEKEGRDRP